MKRTVQCNSGQHPCLGIEGDGRDLDAHLSHHSGFEYFGFVVQAKFEYRNARGGVAQRAKRRDAAGDLNVILRPDQVSRLR